jgi:hypothetical protein
VLGQYRNPEIAFNTFVFVLRDTIPDLFTTRDTVAVETPASLAMSFTVHDWTFRPKSAMVFLLEVT